MQVRKELILAGVAILMLVMGTTVPALAQSSSANYRVEESFFGVGGELDANSANYRAKQSAGELTVGNPKSNNYQFYGGFNTTDVPLLEFAVNGGLYDMGVLSASAPGTAVATFTVRNYLSSGYIVLAHGTPPTVTGGNSHALPALSTATASSPGTEQFGINLADNSNPDIGSNPSQSPDSSFGYGAAIAGYDTANLFKFIDGDTIAFSPKSSGQTNYALSMIANVSPHTPAGQYGGRLNLQVVPTF